MNSRGKSLADEGVSRLKLPEVSEIGHKWGLVTLSYLYYGQLIENIMFNNKL